MTNLGFWCSLPFVLPQALGVRRRTPRFSGPAEPLRGSFGPVPTARILGIGDSIIAGVGAISAEQTLTAQFAACWSRATQTGVEWNALGRIGATTERIAAMAAQLPGDDSVDIILVSAGVNDITTLTRLSRWLGAIDRLLDHLREKHPRASIVMLGIPPLEVFPALPAPLRQVMGSRARYFDRRVREHLREQGGCRYLPIEHRPTANEFSADGFHPSIASYATLAASITELALSAR